jgi:hypothetical protein
LKISSSRCHEVFSGTKVATSGSASASAVGALEQLLDCERKRILFAAFVVIVCPNIVLDVAIISTDCSDGTCVLVEAIEVRLSWGCKVASPNPV